MILVTGATGKTGSRVLNRLCEAGRPARALVRTPAKAESLPAGAEAAIGCFEDPVSLDAAVSGCSAVYLVSPAGPEQRRQEGSVIEAVQRSGTGARIVKLGALGIGDPAGGRIAVQHGQIREDLVASGLPWTVVAPCQLFHNLFLYAAPVFAEGILPVAAGDARIPWVDADDVAAVAVAALTRPEYVWRTLEVTGPEALHHDQVAELLSGIAGRPVHYVDIPPEAAIAGMVAGGVPEWVANGVVEWNRFYVTYPGSPTGVVEEITGRVPAKMVDFLASTAPQWEAIKVQFSAAAQPV